MKVILLRDMDSPNGRKPAGTKISNPAAFRLVQMGVAKPADEECLARCDEWAEKVGRPLEKLIAAAAHAYDRTAAGIHPEDFDKFDRREITGYNADGSFKPGPNAKPENHGGIVVVDE